MTAPNVTIQYANVGSGMLVSSSFEIGRAQNIAVHFPVLSSAAAFLLGSYNSSAENFVRMHSPHPNSGTYQMFPGPGSMAIVVNPVVLPMRFGKVEFTASQDAVRTLTLITRC